MAAWNWLQQTALFGDDVYVSAQKADSMVERVCSSVPAHATDHEKELALFSFVRDGSADLAIASGLTAAGFTVKALSAEGSDGEGDEDAEEKEDYVGEGDDGEKSEREESDGEVDFDDNGNVYVYYPGLEAVAPRPYVVPRAEWGDVPAHVQVERLMYKRTARECMSFRGCGLPSNHNGIDPHRLHSLLNQPSLLGDGVDSASPTLENAIEKALKEEGYSVGVDAEIGGQESVPGKSLLWRPQLLGSKVGLDGVALTTIKIALPHRTHHRSASWLIRFDSIEPIESIESIESIDSIDSYFFVFLGV